MRMQAGQPYEDVLSYWKSYALQQSQSSKMNEAFVFIKVIDTTFHMSRNWHTIHTKTDQLMIHPISPQQTRRKSKRWWAKRSQQRASRLSKRASLLDQRLTRACLSVRVVHATQSPIFSFSPVHICISNASRCFLPPMSNECSTPLHYRPALLRHC